MWLYGTLRPKSKHGTATNPSISVSMEMKGKAVQVGFKPTTCEADALPSELPRIKEIRQGRPFHLT